MLIFNLLVINSFTIDILYVPLMQVLVKIAQKKILTLRSLYFFLSKIVIFCFKKNIITHGVFTFI
jgi:hypothetical protein